MLKSWQTELSRFESDLPNNAATAAAAAAAAAAAPATFPQT